jgi:hypothetical protein
MKLHPDQIGEPDGEGRIKVGVRNWFGPDPGISGYVSSRVDLSHLGDPPRVVSYSPLVTFDDPATPEEDVTVSARMFRPV